MTPERLDLAGSHLSEEAFEDILLGLAAPESLAHTHVCPACRSRIQSFRSDVNLFGQSSLAWSQAKANTVTRDLSEHHLNPTLTLTSVSSYTAAAAVVLATLLTAGVHQHSLTRQAVETNTMTADTDEIAADNDLLQSIDTELRRPDTISLVLAPGHGILSRQVNE